MTSEKATSERSSELCEENSIVVLTRPLETDQGVLPAGTSGVVHDVLSDGTFYLVEFDDPFFCVVEVPADQLRPE